MKKIILFLIPLAAFIGCSDDNEGPSANCQVNGVTIFEEASTRFVFAPDGADGYNLSTIVVYDNTDSSYVYSYEYNGGVLQSITQTKDGGITTYTTNYDGDKLTKLVTAGGDSDLAGELLLIYSGNDVTSVETWLKAVDNQLYQAGHISFTYDGSGNLTKSELNFDIVMLFTIAFGQVPTASYAPELLGSVAYEYGQDNAPNPLQGIYYMEGPDFGFMKNMPINVIEKDASGNTVNSSAYEIAFNEFGYPIKATSGASYIEAFYDCQ